ncbi:MAG: 16S rRNA (cytidine(1402)-2'-O)-methyltransferase [Alphaproteobacteria bacterium]|nr:16S rRNA (cytidine(1402)-2'-O)-methyltransferase [Alphaproteobacteria bacterium]
MTKVLDTSFLPKLDLELTEKNSQAISSGLYLVATPIGNLQDISLRALTTLAKANLIACEDTRITKRLLNKYGITTPVLSYHDHNAEKIRPILLTRLAHGESIALVSDAGTPLISDPGYKLVRACIDKKIMVTTIPGASSLLSALQLSGLPTDRFFFVGFLPPKSHARKVILQEIIHIPATLIFFETGPRLIASLQDMAEIWGERQASVARELTKVFEETKRDTLANLYTYYNQHGHPKGEIVIVVGPPSNETLNYDIDTLLKEALATMSCRDAVKEIAQKTNISKQKIYKQALKKNIE